MDCEVSCVVVVVVRLGRQTAVRIIEMRTRATLKGRLGCGRDVVELVEWTAA